MGGWEVRTQNTDKSDCMILHGYSMALHGPESEHKQAEKTDGAKMHCIGKGRWGELGEKKKQYSELIFSLILHSVILK